MPPSFCAKIINLFPLYVEDLGCFWFDLLWCLLGVGDLYPLQWWWKMWSIAFKVEIDLYLLNLISFAREGCLIKCYFPCNFI